MNILQIIAIGIVCTVLSMFLKKDAPEYSTIIGICCGIIIFMAIMPKLYSVLEIINNISSRISIDNGYITIILKVIGIAYLSEFAMQICHDAEEGVIASKIELTGKVMIMVLSAPILLTLMDMILTIA